MEEKEKDNYLSILKKGTNRPLVVCLLWTVAIGSVASCLIAKEHSMTGKLQDVTNYLIFAVLILLVGICLLWYQIKSLHNKLDAVAGLLDSKVEIEPDTDAEAEKESPEKEEEEED